MTDANQTTPTEQRKKKWRSCGCLVLTMLLIAVLLGIFFLPRYVSWRRYTCDMMVQKQLERLANAFAKLSAEAKEQGIQWNDETFDAIAAQNCLQYMAGSHYDWYGCFRECSLYFRMVKSEGQWVIEGMALHGDRYKDRDTRYVYRRTLATGKPLESTKGRITDLREHGKGGATEWIAYPRSDDRGLGLCYKGPILTAPGSAESPRPKVSKPEQERCPECPGLTWYQHILCFGGY